jgi:hypothetical protein
MSGGHWDYIQERMMHITVDIPMYVRRNGIDDPEVVRRLNEAVRAVRVAAMYVERVDWLISGDDSEESFLRRVREDLARVGKENQQ